MENSPFSGVLGLIACVVLFFAARTFFPGLSTILMVIVGIAIFLIVLIIVLVIVFSKSGTKNKKGGASAEVNAILSKGRSNLMEIRRMSMKIKNQQIRKESEEICKSAEKIFKTLKEQPENISSVRQFFNYYLPTLGKILLKYARVEESEIDAEDLTKSTISYLADIRSAMEKQYTNLFEDDMIDLTVEMEAFTLNCKRDGLLSDEADPGHYALITFPPLCF